MVLPRATRWVSWPRNWRSSWRRSLWEVWNSNGMSSGDMGAASGRCLRTFHGLRGRLGRRRVRQFERQLAVDADDLVVALVGFDDLLHQIVAHHIAIVELHEA